MQYKATGTVQAWKLGHVLAQSANAERMLLSLTVASNGGEGDVVVAQRQMEAAQEQRLLLSLGGGHKGAQWCLWAGVWETCRQLCGRVCSCVRTAQAC